MTIKAKKANELTPQEAAHLLLRLQDAESSFLGFVRLIQPEWEIPDFHLQLIETLDKLEKGTLLNDAGQPIRRVLITMPPRHSKALAINTAIPTPQGYKRMLDIQPGDQVFSPCGSPVSVKSVSPIFVNHECYAVQTSDGATVIADADHLWTARLDRKHPAWLQHTTKSLYERWQRNPNARAPRLPEQQPVEYPEAELPIAPYVLGLWLGDGNTSAPQLTASQEDADYYAGKITACGLRPGRQWVTNTAVCFTIHDTRSKLIDLGVLGQKHIPDQYITASIEQRRSLLKGLMDSDGSVSKAGQCFFSNTNYEIIKGFRQLLWSLGIRNSLICTQAKLYDKNCGPTYKVSFYDDDCCTLPRKRERLRPANKHFGRYIKAIWPVATRPTKCITVDSEDGLFLAGRGHIPTHNSSYASELFPAYYLARNPRRHVLATSYSAELAKKFGRAVRELARDPKTHQAFPAFSMSRDSQAADEWHTTEGGSYKGVGIGGGTTGFPANALIMDDVVKNRAEAESMTYRERIWDFYVSSLENRKEPLDQEQPIELLIMTRWHPDDLAGRLMRTDDWAKGRWLHINFPAIQEIETGEEVSRKLLPPDHPLHIPQDVPTWKVAPNKRHYKETKRVALWPSRFPIEELDRKRALNERDFEALYQQKPYIEGGNIIKLDWWQWYDEVPHLSCLIIAVDTSFKKGQDNDYSVALVAGISPEGDIYITDVVRAKYDFPELKDRMIRLNAHYRGRGLRAFYIEDKASGQSLIQELKRQSGLSVIPYKVNNDKVARVNAITPLIEGGRVYLPKKAPWLDDFVNEAIQFPNGTHDDQVDALSIALDSLSRMSVQSAELMSGPIDASRSLNQEAMFSPGLRSGDSLSATLQRKRRPMAWGEL